ncbi:MAG: PHP domain-containing protein [Bacteroidales bacterium]|nr:PHP domain-containing protein [Bacteroidales bacterium]
MGWTNFHSHSTYSDGKESIAKCAEIAVQNKMEIYGFSDHSPIPFKNDWSLKIENLTDYLAEITQIKDLYKGSTEFLCGLEIDYLPGSEYSTRSFIESLHLDYFIGSVHFVDSFKDGTPWNIDTGADLFERCKRDF